jgi:hypothetical protein
VALLLTLVITTLVLTALFWGGGLVLQGWLYSEPASRFWQRALAAGAGVALFLTFWCWVNGRSGGKVDTLFNFSQYDTQEITQFESVRKTRSGEEVFTYRRSPSARGSASFVGGRPGQPVPTPWSRSDADAIVVALLVQEEGKDKPTRFEAQLDANGKFPPGELRYIDKETGRYISADNLGEIVRVRGGLVFWNFVLNLLHFGVWLVALWFGLRFSFGHAFGLALICWLAMELVVLPVMFQQTRPTPSPAAPTAPVSPGPKAQLRSPVWT